MTIATPSGELLAIADKLDTLATRFADEGIAGPLRKLGEAAEEVGKAASGSWIGYHANVYYSGLKPPPPGAHFSAEWGLHDTYSQGSTGEWAEFSLEVVQKEIRKRAGNPPLSAADSLASEANRVFDRERAEALSVLSSVLAERNDTFLTAIKEEIEKLRVFTRAQAIEALRPSSIYTRDSTAASQGIWTPPHVLMQAQVFSMRQPLQVCGELAQACRKAGSHLARVERKHTRSREVGTNVFIGHGASGAWRDLKDFIQDRLKLPYDEFNRVPVAGVTNVERLKEMLDSAAIAFLVMTAEDERSDGKRQARMNVVHEAGLFQGRLGFNKAIVLLEEGCEEFSNIEGLGQIRFPKGNISAKFEDIRRVLEREGLLI